MAEALVFVPEDEAKNDNDLLALVAEVKARLERYFCDNLKPEEFCELMKIARTVHDEEKTYQFESAYDTHWEIAARAMYNLYQKELRDIGKNFFVTLEKMTDEERIAYFDHLRYPKTEN
jgi:hypothetical protein